MIPVVVELVRLVRTCDLDPNKSPGVAVISAYRYGVRILIAALASVIVFAPQPGSGQEPDVPLLPPGLHTRTLERKGGPPLGYAIMVPRGYAPEARVPLVLALHFGGEPAEGNGRSVIALLVGPALEELDAVIVAPDALTPGWNSPVNEEAVMRLLDLVERRYNVDPRRVIVTGFSMGGSGTWHYAARFPDRFSAAVPVAGRPVAGDAWRVPVFAVGSRRDTLVPIGPTVQRIEELKKMGVNAEVIVLDTPTHFQTGAHAEGLQRAAPWLQALWRRTVP